MLRIVRAFWHDQRGVALILVSITLPAIIGFSLLAIDMSRVNNLHNDLQKGTDSLSIAAAAELDGKSDSITRADRALAMLVGNQYNFTTDGPLPGPQPLSVSDEKVTRRYLRSLPATDNLPITAANVITDEVADASEARFVEVSVSPAAGFSAIFPVSFLSPGSNGDWTIGAVSVAGFKSGVCDFTPVFICNPYENDPDGHTLEEAVATTDLRRRLIELRKVGNGAAAGPGNFGFLEPPDGVGNGAQALAQTIATSRPIGCYSAEGVDTKTGQNAGPVQDAFNVRFGIAANGHFNSAEYGPAANVRKGASSGGNGNGNGNGNGGGGGNCPRYNQLTFGTPNMGLPRDPSAPYMNGRMGDGNWDFSGYWSTNFGSATYPSSWDTTKPSRYEVYKYEISAGLVGTASIGGEVGTPPNSCQPPVTTVDRRLIYGAILNCAALEETNDLSGHSTGLPVEAFASFFLTEPVSSPSDDASVMVELVDITGRGGQGTLDNFLRDEAQLYR
ncbi:pilus assembly protein TadG-related protein [Mesorhizobium sp.]|uniref:pilus assembly protein TadG-related protein n=1 Tax=Mesorhizobium sp. TaxID=1871066 RepID=UPI00121DE9FC|nr:pilus assembly protein TadG-related protein [Mesorhizobium sp.]TIL67017.1 MAG: hypothetical protein E5Y77_14025 [Mesorhizobium sp.]